MESEGLGVAIEMANYKISHQWNTIYSNRALGSRPIE